MESFEYLMQVSDIALSQIHHINTNNTVTSHHNIPEVPASPIDSQQFLQTTSQSILLGTDLESVPSSVSPTAVQANAFWSADVPQTITLHQQQNWTPVRNQISSPQRSTLVERTKPLATRKSRKTPYSVLDSDGNSRPQISYAGMIVQAIISSPGARMTLRGIYDWVQETYPYFKNAAKNWQVLLLNSYRVQL